MQSGGNETTASKFEDIDHHPGLCSDVPSYISPADYENQRQRQSNEVKNQGSDMDTDTCKNCDEGADGECQRGLCTGCYESNRGIWPFQCCDGHWVPDEWSGEEPRPIWSWIWLWLKLVLLRRLPSHALLIVIQGLVKWVKPRAIYWRFISQIRLEGSLVLLGWVIYSTMFALWTQGAVFVVVIQCRAVNTVWNVVTAVEENAETTQVVQQNIAHHERSFTFGYKIVHVCAPR